MRNPSISNVCDVCHQQFSNGSTLYKMEGYFIVEKPICITCCEKENKETEKRQQERDKAILKGPYAHLVSATYTKQ